MEDLGCSGCLLSVNIKTLNGDMVLTVLGSRMGQVVRPRRFWPLALASESPDWRTSSITYYQCGLRKLMDFSEPQFPPSGEKRFAKRKALSLL